VRSAAGDRLLLVRFEPGDDVCGGLREAFATTEATAAVVTAVVGSVRHVRYLMAALDLDGRPSYSAEQTRSGAIEIGAAQGHLASSRDNVQAELHLHGLFVDDHGRAFGGHVLQADVLVTVEVALLLSYNLGWIRDHVVVEGSDPLPVLHPHQPRSGERTR